MSELPQRIRGVLYYTGRITPGSPSDDQLIEQIRNALDGDARAAAEGFVVRFDADKLLRALGADPGLRPGQ